MEFTHDDMESLGEKLAALDLTDGEREALRTVVAIAADATADEAEVSGYYSVWIGGSVKADVGSLGLKLGPPTRGFASADLGGTRAKIIAADEGETI
ncbi:MAG: hypothetical protein ACE367_00420 [Acidimicrobiales bacterium]